MKNIRYQSYIIVITLLIPIVSVAQDALSLALRAATEGKLPDLRGVVERGLGVDSTDSDGNTLLILASRAGHLDVMEYLVQRKADVNRRNAYGDTALLVSAAAGNLQSVKYLRSAGGKDNASGWLPVHYAAFGGHADLVAWLLANGAEKNAQAPNGYTALMLAARNGHLEAARQLLYVDADYRVTGPRGETALALAMRSKVADLVDLLQRAGARE